MTEAELSIGTPTATRLVDFRPVGIRWLVKADGSKVLQFAHTWQEGLMRGVDWVDVPEVKE